MNLLSLTIVSALLSLNLHAKSCLENRMGFDIGSGSTKMLVAEVNICEKKLVKVLLQDSKPVAYNEDFEKSANGTIGPEMEAKGLSVLKEFVELGKIHKPKTITGVATSVFRKAKNGKEIIERFSKKLKIKLQIISQEEEAELGYSSAVSTIRNEDDNLLKDEKKKVVVWDIGGGSMQMSMMDEKKKLKTYLGNLASVNFKNMVIEVFQLKSLETTTSPNPIGLSRPNAIALARSYAKLHVPEEFTNKNRDVVYIGVGGVHGQSVKNQLQLKEMKYSFRDIDDSAIQQAQKYDKDLTGDYRSTDVTNLLLIQGFMEAMGIREVLIANASLLQGLLIR